MTTQHQEEPPTQPDYKPTDHGMVTDVFLADFLDALPSDSDSDDDGNDSQQPAAGPAYVPQLASPLYSFLGPFLPSPDSPHPPPSVASIVHHQLLNNPLGPSSVRATIDYLYWHKLFRTCERVCAAWIAHTKPPLKQKHQRIATCKDPAQTGLMCAYRLKDADMLVRNWIELASVGSTLDPHARFLLGSVHLHFPEGLSGEGVGVEEVAEQLRYAVEAKAGDVQVWIVLRDLFANAAWVTDHALGMRVAQLAQVRAFSILDVAKVDAGDEQAKRRWERMVAKVEDGYSAVLPAEGHDSKQGARVLLRQGTGDQGSDTVLLFPPPHHPLMVPVPHYSAMAMNEKQVEDALVSWCTEVESWTFTTQGTQSQLGEHLAALIQLVHKETFRHVARRVCPAVWAMGRTGIVVVPGIPQGAIADPKGSTLEVDDDDTDAALAVRDM